MNTNRIKELQDFANDFNNRLKFSEKSLIEEKKLITFPLNRRIKNSFSTLTPRIPFSAKKFNNTPNLNKNQNAKKIKRAIKSCKKKPIKLNNNIYKNLLPWRPPHYVGNYFEDFKILQDKHNLSSWEKVIKKNLIIY